MASSISVPQTPDVCAGLVVQLQEAARSGDWVRLEELADLLPLEPLPESQVALADYLFQLRATLIAAKTTRADVVKSLHRLSAASRFNQFG